MAKQRIEARVIQKIATEAEWLDNDLILYEGEIALVWGTDRVVNMKVGDGGKPFSELKYIYEGGFLGSVNPTTATSELPNGFYIAESVGSYPNSIVVAEGYYTILEKNDNGWKVASSVKIPSVNINQTFQPTSIDAQSGVAVNQAINSQYVYEQSTKQIFDKNDYINNTTINSSNVTSVQEGSGLTIYYTIPTNTTHISWSGLSNTTNKRIAWVDDNENLISTNTISLSNGTVSIPIGAKKFRFQFKLPTDDISIIDTFMLQFGAIQNPYEPYISVKSVMGTEFLKKVPSLKTNFAYAVLSGVSPTVNSSGWYKACPVVEDVAMKGCTGYGFDAKRNLHIVAEYNTTISSRLLLFRPQDLVERNLTTKQISVPYKVIDISEHIDHIQGVTWDWVDDTYLALGTKKGQATTGFTIVVKISVFGQVLGVIDVPDMTIQVGMIDLDYNGNILIKPNTGSALYIFNRAYKLIDRKTLIANEGLAVNKYNGDIWCANDAFVVKKYDKNYNELGTFDYNTFTNESSGSNVEGMVILPDGSLVICADAYLHGGTELGNCLFFFDFDKTVNKKLYFYLPNGVGNFKSNESEYLTEIIEPKQTITSVVVSADYPNELAYRSASTYIATTTTAWSNTLTSNTFFQLKIVKK